MEMSVNAHPPLSRTLGRPLVVLAVALAVGFVIGHPWAALAVAALGVLAWQQLQLRRLVRRLASRQRVAVGAGGDAWSDLQQLLHRNQEEHRHRAQRLVEMLRAYRAAAAALPDAVVVLERNTQRVQWFNAAASDLLGLHYPEDTQAPLGERLRPLPIAHWLAGGRNAERLLDVASPINPGMRLSLRLIPYSDELWLLVARDVTKLMHLEHIRRDFVANVSHELRTPLTVIHGYLEMLDPADQPDWAPILVEMQRQSQRMTQLVEDLLTLSRLESQDSINDEVVSLDSTLATLRREAEALGKGQQTVTAEDRAGVDLLGSPRELHSAFSNLVSNAVRYTPANGSISIIIDLDEDGGVMLSVRDTGYGIPESHLARLTERFYRVSTSRSRELGGTGLGLAIAKHVLQLHQARLEISSEVGQGSVFTCRFPAGRTLPRTASEDFDP